jgi:hypothetical protein
MHQTEESTPLPMINTEAIQLKCEVMEPSVEQTIPAGYAEATAAPPSAFPCDERSTTVVANEPVLSKSKKRVSTSIEVHAKKRSPCVRVRSRNYDCHSVQENLHDYPANRRHY